MTEYKIYKIKSSLTDKIYIGSTSKTLTERLSRHKTDYNAWLKDNNSSYLTSFEILKYNDYLIELIESFICIDKLERNEKEGHFLKLNKLICVNKRIETRTRKEYRETHKEEQKQYYQDNKEEKKQYRETHKEELKQYRDTRKEEKKQYDKEYKESHREKVNEKHICSICKRTYTNTNKSKHIKSIKHLEKLNQASCDITITYDKEIGHIKKLS